jgi:hypothetical protein
MHDWKRIACLSYGTMFIPHFLEIEHLVQQLKVLYVWEMAPFSHKKSCACAYVLKIFILIIIKKIHQEENLYTFCRCHPRYRQKRWGKNWFLEMLKCICWDQKELLLSNYTLGDPFICMILSFVRFCRYNLKVLYRQNAV